MPVPSEPDLKKAEVSEKVGVAAGGRRGTDPSDMGYPPFDDELVSVGLMPPRCGTKAGRKAPARYVDPADTHPSAVR